MRRSITTAAVAASVFSSAASAQNIDSKSCTDGLFMLVARGTTEPKGTGVTGLIADRIAERIPDSKVVGLDYPATFTDPFYNDSVDDGSDQMRAAVRNYTESCPKGKLAVFGYSQGAQVTGNTFCGGTGGEFDDKPALSKDIVDDHVIAIVLFGDPTHIANTTFDEGTSKNDGISDRKNLTACEDYSFLKSYCDTGDFYCDSGKDRSVHGQYVQRYGQDVVKFVIKEWNDATGGKIKEDAGGPFTVPGDESSTTTQTKTSMVSTPAATPSTTSSTGTATKSTAETPTGTGSGDNGSSGGGAPDAAAGLSAMGSMMIGAPLMALALWNVL